MEDSQSPEPKGQANVSQLYDPELADKVTYLLGGNKPELKHRLYMQQAINHIDIATPTYSTNALIRIQPKSRITRPMHLEACKEGVLEFLLHMRDGGDPHRAYADKYVIITSPEDSLFWVLDELTNIDLLGVFKDGQKLRDWVDTTYVNIVATMTDVSKDVQKYIEYLYEREKKFLEAVEEEVVIE